MSLLEKLDKLVEKLGERLLEARREARRLAVKAREQGLLNPLPALKPPEAYAGVDGWLYRLLTLGGLAVYYLRAVAIVLPDSKWRMVLEDLNYYPLEYGVEDADEAAEYDMMAMEARALLEASSHAELLVVDGPLVDPPREPRGGVARVRHKGYHKLRATMLSKAFRRTLVVGFVKKPRSERLLAPILGWRGYDIDAATTVLEEYRGFMLGPIRLRGGVYSEYESLGICTSYIMAPWWPHAARVEAPCSRIGEACSLLLALTPKGSLAPIPVQAAHQLASIGRSGVEGLRRALVEKIAVKAGWRLVASS